MKRIEPPLGAITSAFIPHCPSQATAAILADRWAKRNHSVLIVVGETLADAESKCEDIAALYESTNPGVNIKFHSFDKLQGPDHPDSFDKACERLTLLSALREVSGKNSPDLKILISTTLDALLGPCPLVTSTTNSEIILSAGTEFSYDRLSELLITKLDYSSEVVCEEPGQFAIRGGIIDIYPVNADSPVRIDFFGDMVEEIRTFDPTTQRATGQIPEIRISPIDNQDSLEREGEFFSYLPPSVFWHMEEPENLLRSFPLAFHETGDQKTEKANFSLAWKRKSPGSDHFLTTSEIDGGAGIFGNGPREPIQLEPLVAELESFTKLDSIGIEDGKQSRLSSKVVRSIKKYSSSGYAISISLGAESEKKRIESILQENELGHVSVHFLTVGLHQGFIYTKTDQPPLFDGLIQEKEAGLLLATSREILGRERSRRPLRSRKAFVQRKEVDQALDFAELVDGDILVHLQHGICRFGSMGRIEQDNQTEEAITVEFADGILLHVPLQESHLLSRYVGLKKAKPKLAKLGGKTWAKTKEAAELAAIDLAADLLRLQASRDSEKGHAFAADDRWQNEFEDAFPYSETPDQLRSILEVKNDMESDKPMDRLVCGDVGYGKTEVAMRAAFKAIMDGKQVALLAPTTILCQQHLQSFSGRMMDFPVTLEMLSRFRTRSQQKKIMDGLKSGAIDLVIGTHRMFSDGLKFKDLGLLIIDEEQRFGVEHKEKLKRMSANIDVLTLSATPIPRTLYFAMVGVRSFSTIETAPTNRKPIRTEVIRGSDDILKKAIQLELRRGGQIFYLHNRVKTIQSTGRKLQSLFPELRIAVGHGQMSENELEQIMVEFISGQYDLLLCTTIIESGLDIPNCNTIIIEDADKFGLSQLYQLRGRVGRFTRQAYAYLMVNPSLPVKDKARKRLAALRSTSSMGAGFKIALRDLELRGAGNLLGSEQSGHIAGVGFEMYCKLLKESVSRLKGEEISLRPTAVVRLDFIHTDDSIDPNQSSKVIASCLPASYINEPRLRIEFYRKIAEIVEIDQISQLKEELLDRFGPIPDEVHTLFLETEIKCLAQKAGLDSVSTQGNQLLCRKVRRSNKACHQYLKKMDQIPRLSSSRPLLKLNEIIRFLKIHLHGKQLPS